MQAESLDKADQRRKVDLKVQLCRSCYRCLHMNTMTTRTVLAIGL